MIIDAHVHLPSKTEHGTFEQAKRTLLSNLRRDKVDYAILIPDNQLDSPIGDLDTCLEIIEGESQLYLLGTIDIQQQGQEWINKLEKLIKQRKIVGVKIYPGHDPIYPTDPRLLPVYSLCQTCDVPIVIHTGQNSGNPEASSFLESRLMTLGHG